MWGNNTPKQPWTANRAGRPGLLRGDRKQMSLSPAHAVDISNDITAATPYYMDLKVLAAYASCSVRWLRDRLVDRSCPLPHYRIAGKLLVKRDEFDAWMRAHRVETPSIELDQIVDGVVRQVTQPGHVA